MPRYAECAAKDGHITRPDAITDCRCTHHLRDALMSRTPVSSLRLYVYVLSYVFGIMAFFRIIFWIYAGGGMADPLGEDAFRAFYIGLRFDARIAALFTLPIGAALCMPPAIRALRRRAALVTALYSPFFFLLMAVYATDIGFYGYLGSRVNKLLFELLEDFRVAVEMVTQSYPVVWIVLGVLAATALALSGLYRLLRIPACAAPDKKRRALGFAAGFLLFAFCVYGQINASLFPLRWSYAYFTTEEPVIALGLNPVQSLYDTYGASVNSFDLKRTREAYPAMAKFLLVDNPNPETLAFERRFAGARPQGATAPPINVVVIIMESLAYPKTSFAPGPADPTPRLRELAGESMLFHNFFANARTTARAIFSTVTGIPDVNEGSTGSRNPMVVDQRIVFNEFKEYDKYYLIGGNTSWANIRAVLSHNVERLDILEEKDWDSPSADVWGVSDYDLFREAHALLASRPGDKPFIAVIQTASYHKPYTVPETPLFTHESLNEEGLRAYGFYNEHEYNSMRYADFAVGEFMRLAKSAEYYKNTVFFIFGDHGLNETSGTVRGGYKAGHLWPWHVPLIIHAAPELGLVAPGESDMPCGQVDVLPTAAGLAGISYRNYTLGRDIFDDRYAQSRAVYIGGKEGTPVRLVWDGYCYSDNLLGRKELFRLDDAQGIDRATEDPERFTRYDRLARDIDATARYMLFNNRKERKRNTE